MNNWKKFTAACMGAAMVGTTVFGASATVFAADTVTLDVWHQFTDPESAQTQAFEAAVEEYEKEHENIKIELHGLDTESYKTKISTEFASSASGVDVFYYWAPGKLKQLTDADKVLPLNDYVTDDIKSRIKEGSTSNFELDGNLYALPIDSYMMCLFCNKDLFDQAGVEIPTTYDELITAGEALAKLDGVTPLAIGAKDAWLAGALYESLALREVGASEVQSALLGETEFTNEGFKKAAEDVVELYDKGILGKNPLEDGEAEATADFLNGKVAMQLDGSWFAGASFFVNKNTDTPEESADFAMYISEKMGEQALEIGTGFPCWNTDVDTDTISPTFVKLMDLYDGVKTGVQNWDGIINANAAAVHLEQAQSLLSGSADIDSFMTAHQDAISAAE